MATKKISELTELTSPAGTEELIVNAGGTSKKITLANLPDNDTVYAHPNHSGDVTSTADGDTVITSGAVDIAMLSATGTASSSNFLRGDNTWVTPTDTDTVYTHPTGDGNLHVPVTSTTNNGKYLQAGSSAGSLSWADVDALPTQTSNADKFLTTNGTVASWADLDTDANTTTKGMYENHSVISTSYSITANNNAMSAGPITVNSGITVTVPATSTWTII